MLSNYLHWITDAALPAWAERGFDAEAGRFRERLDQAGTDRIAQAAVMVCDSTAQKFRQPLTRESSVDDRLNGVFHRLYSIKTNR